MKKKTISTKPNWKYSTRVTFALVPCDDAPLPLHVFIQNASQFADMNSELLEEFQKQLSFNDNDWVREGHTKSVRCKCLAGTGERSNNGPQISWSLV